MTSISSRSRCRVLAFAAISLLTPAVVAEGQASTGGRSEVFAGSEIESYLRYLETLDRSGVNQWSLRPFSPVELERVLRTDSAHPWALRYDLQAGGVRRAWDYIRPNLVFRINSAYAHGGNDGAVWAGKGLTSSFQTGVFGRFGPLSATIAPIFFRAENQSFPMFSNGQPGRLRYADGQFPLVIDRPQRFGNLPYGRLDPGQSTIRVDLGVVAAGATTANEWWGPTDRYPYVLGNNAPGFPRVFFGSSRPTDVGIGLLHGRVSYGVLDQSAYSPVSGPVHFENFQQPGRRRFMAGIVGVFQPRGLTGLELGGSRFFHSAWDIDGVTGRQIALPFQNFLKSRIPRDEEPIPEVGDPSSGRENQLASAYLRWALPGSGFEVYGEYGREDHSADTRDLLMQFDHAAATTFGLRKAWMRQKQLHGIRAELMTYEASAGSRTRGEGQIYLHGVLRQGHTHRGQMLGANVGPGSGSAASFAYDRYGGGGKLTAFLTRVTAHERRTEYAEGPPVERAVDVMTSIGTELVRFIGPFDVTGGITLTFDVNRYFTADRMNTSLLLGVRQNF